MTRTDRDSPGGATEAARASKLTDKRPPTGETNDTEEKPGWLLERDTKEGMSLDLPARRGT